LTSVGLPSSLFDQVDDNAKVNKFVLNLDYKWVSVNLNLLTSASDGLTHSATQINISNAAANGVYLNQNFDMPLTVGGAMTGAQLKAAAASMTIDIAPAQSGVAGTINVRNVKMSVCYQNLAPLPNQPLDALMMCEV